ncbi:hypothetical protein F3J27_10115 [Enterobacter sp. Ap-916]|uniref:hypothetical protein n=2 Tax=Enterobacterales TaxID=91347 RepID=UPI00141F7AF6|nr:hypothetical protein [Enterobacter sp. Ap-916]
MRKLIPAVVLLLSGCINVYGPVKPGAQGDSTQPKAPGMDDAASIVKIGNRKPQELFNAVTAYYQQKRLNPTVQDNTTGIVAAVSSDEGVVSTYLDCSALPQTQNIQEQSRIVTQIWSAGEGSNVSVVVTGVVGLVTSDGNDKVKPVECKSTGLFEKDLLEILRK